MTRELPEPPAILCVHGWACEGAQFAGLGALLRAAGCRVVCPDLPGHGSTPLDGFRPGFPEYARWIADFALAHGLGEAAVIGHSMGGVLALLAAAGDARFRPRAIVNLDGALPATDAVLAGQATLRDWLGRPDFRPRLAGLLRETFFLPHERDDRCDAIVRAMCAAPEEVLRFLPERIGTLRPEEILRHVRTPVLYIGSAAPRFDAARTADWLADFRLERVPDAGHFLHIYAAERVAALATEFFRAAGYSS
jgi:pimeloyl-ACP methyl ester carboxylesterase